jgi:hypothetical protein
MTTKSNGMHAITDTHAAEANTGNKDKDYATGSVTERYPSSSIASLLDSQLAHRTLKYGVEMATFALMNVFFPKRTSWIARVALPLAVNYVLGRWIEENYDQWVQTLAQREYERNAHPQPTTGDSVTA